MSDDDRAGAPAGEPLPWLPLPPWHEEALAAALERRGTWPHALLLHGRAGIGKEALALAFAQALLCETPRADGRACGECPSCRYAVAGQHPDLMRVTQVSFDDDGVPVWKETIGVDRIRDVTAFTQLTAHRQRAKVVVIAPAERMNANAANALLKTLEEPPPATYLLLVAAAPGRLPATIVSRCRKLPVAIPAAEAVVPWLAEQGLAEPALALAQAGGAPFAALAYADAGWQGERRAWLAALADPTRLPGARDRRADRRRRQGRAAGAARPGARPAARLGGRSRPGRLRRGPARASGLRGRARPPGPAGGAFTPVSLSSGAVAATRAAGAPAAAAARRRGHAARLPGAVRAGLAPPRSSAVAPTRPRTRTRSIRMAEKPTAVATNAALAASMARPGVLSLNIREKAALYAAYMPFLRGGGIFIPTSRTYTLGEEVFMLLSLMDDPNRIAVQGKVVWVTPDGVQGNRTQGIGVQFTQDETGAAARATIEKILGETLASSRPTHTM